MAALTLTINGRPHEVSAAPDTPLLWVLRDELGLTGTKYGCGIGECGACTVLLGDEAVRSCSLTVREAAGRAVTTIEGLGAGRPHPLQDIWRELEVPQCGYCQPGQLLTAAALLKENPHPTQEQIVERMSGVLCRCGTYGRILQGIQLAAAGDRP